MDTKEVIIDENTMEMAKEYSIRSGMNLKDLLDSYTHFVTEGYKEFTKNVSPEVKAMQRRNRIALDLPADFDWKEEVGNEMYKKYTG